MFPSKSDDRKHLAARFDPKPEPKWLSYTSVDQVVEEMVEAMRSLYQSGSLVFQLTSQCSVYKLETIPAGSLRYLQNLKEGRINYADRVRFAGLMRIELMRALARKIDTTKLDLVIFNVEIKQDGTLRVSIDMRIRNWSLTDPRVHRANHVPAVP